MALSSWLCAAKPASLLLFLLGTASAADEPAQTGSVASQTATVRTSSRPEQNNLSGVVPAHPLLSVLDYARKEQAYLRQTGARLLLPAGKA